MTTIQIVHSFICVQLEAQKEYNRDESVSHYSSFLTDFFAPSHIKIFKVKFKVRVVKII